MLKSYPLLAPLGMLAVSASLVSTWHAVRAPVSPPLASTAPPLHAVDFVDAAHGWAAGDTILSTTNGGRTWQWQDNPAGPISALDFVNRADGWALGDTAHALATGILLRTTDGGRHWRVANEPILGGQRYTLARISFAGPTLGAGVATPGPNAAYGGPGSRGRAILTTDGGLAWRALPTPTAISALCVADRLDGWAVEAGTGVLLHTADGGRTWSRSLPDGVAGARFFIMGGDISCASARNVWALLYGGAGTGQQTYALYHTADTGAHWTAIAAKLGIGGARAPGTPGIPPKAAAVQSRAPGAYAGPLDAVNGLTAYLGGPSPAEDTVALGGTSDGGHTWHSATVLGLTATGFPGLAFVSARQGWLAANVSPATGVLHGVILHTADGGRAWQQQYPPAAPGTPWRRASHPHLHHTPLWPRPRGAHVHRLHRADAGAGSLR